MKPGDIVTWRNDLSPGRAQRLESDYGPGPYVIAREGPRDRAGLLAIWKLVRLSDKVGPDNTSFDEDLLQICTFLNAAKDAIDETKV